MELETKSIDEKLAKLARDVEQIKQMLLAEREEKETEEIELTDWAKAELKRARETPERDYVSLEDVKKRILSKKQ